MKIGFCADKNNKGAPNQCMVKLFDKLRKLDTKHSFYLVNLEKREKISELDVIHLSQIPSGFEGLISTISSKIVIAHIHGDLMFSFPEYYPGSKIRLYIKKQLKKIFKHEVDYFLPVSNYTKNIIKNNLNIPDKKLKVVYNGVDDIFFKNNYNRDILDKYNINKPFVLHVSNYAPIKNTETLVEAFMKVKEDGLNLIIAGGGHEEKYYSKIKKIKTLGNISQEDLKVFTKRLDVL